MAERESTASPLRAAEQDVLGLMAEADCLQRLYAAGPEDMAAWACLADSVLGRLAGAADVFASIVRKGDRGAAS